MEIQDESTDSILNISTVFDTIEKLYFSDNLPLINGIITKNKYMKIIAKEDKVLLNQSYFNLSNRSDFDEKYISIRKR